MVKLAAALVAAFFFAFPVAPSRADCWPSASQKQCNAGVVNMYLDTGLAVPVDATHGMPVNVIGGTLTAGAITSWAGGTLGAMANYGTSPGAVLVPGFNAFITNTVATAGPGASGAALSGNPLRIALSDGTNTQNWLAAIALADGVNGNNTGATALWYWNGSTYDRARGDATNGAYVQIKSNLYPLGVSPTDRTLPSATGASQTVMAANASRHSLIVQNTGNANCGVNPTGGTAVIGGAGTLTLVPNGSYQPRVPTLSAVTAICTAGQPLYAEEN